MLFRSQGEARGAGAVPDLAATQLRWQPDQTHDQGAVGMRLRQLVESIRRDAANVFALTVYGKIGIKVWICKGEVLGKRDLNPNVVAGGGKEVGERQGGFERRDDRRDDRRGGGGGGGDRRGGGGGGGNRGGGGGRRN